MSFLKKVEAVQRTRSVDFLIKSLYQAVGNKVFMNGIEDLLEEKLVDLTPAQEDDLDHLSRALRNR